MPNRSAKIRYWAIGILFAACAVQVAPTSADPNGTWSVNAGTGPRWFHAGSLNSIADAFFEGRPVRAAISNINSTGNTALALHWRSGHAINDDTRFVYGARFELGEASYYLPDGVSVFRDPITLTAKYASVSPSAGFEQVFYRASTHELLGQFGIGIDFVESRNSLTSALLNVQSDASFRAFYIYSEIEISPQLGSSGFGARARLQRYADETPDVTFSLVYQF